jgi:hypothetical protein
MYEAASAQRAGLFISFYRIAEKKGSEHSLKIITCFLLLFLLKGNGYR